MSQPECFRLKEELDRDWAALCAQPVVPLHQARDLRKALKRAERHCEIYFKPPKGTAR